MSRKKIAAKTLNQNTSETELMTKPAIASPLHDLYFFLLITEIRLIINAATAGMQKYMPNSSETKPTTKPAIPNPFNPLGSALVGATCGTGAL